MLVLALAGLSGACTTGPAAAPVSPSVSATLQGDAARPAIAKGWVRSELYFGVGSEHAAGGAEANISDAQWRAFLDKEVTRRFPDGLTVFDAYGQWLSRDRSEPARLKSKVLVILHEDTPQRTADIEAIRLAWKQTTRHQSVLWSKQAAEVSF
ncbi:MAG: DUF3574 domain-containing protein [Pseudoxanthomonas sp.]